jgi:DNA-binding transcriptional LysR family regulator
MDVLRGMRIYATVVAAGSFTGAAERLGISKALTSKYIGQLEEHLGVRLLNRTTRRLNVTEVGQAYYQRCRQLLDDMDELEAAVRQQQQAPQGRLLVAAPSTFGEMYLTRAVAAFLAEQPGVSVELVLADRFVNIVDEGFDLAVRIGSLADSSLIARRLAPMRVALCASPDYLKSAGVPAHPRQLASLNCVIDTNIQDSEQWAFKEQGRSFRVKVTGRFRVNNALAVREMLLAGHGVGRCPLYVIEDDIRAGRLDVLLQEYEAIEFGIYAVYPHNRHLGAKVRTFVDFLVRRFSASSYPVPDLRP